MDRLLISVTPEQHTWLKRVAENEKISVAEIIRRAIDTARREDAK